MRALKYPALLAFFGMSAIAAPAPGTGEAGAMQNRSITLCVEGGKSFTAVLEDNSSAKALVKLLEKSDISIKMRDYANMEKVGPLGYELPRNDEQTTTSCGDLILYQGNQFVIYYAPNLWCFTRLGKIENADAKELKSALGEGDVTVIISKTKNGSSRL